MSEAQHKYSSFLVPNLTTTEWKINNVDQLQESCCWTCMSFNTEVPMGSKVITKWKISLYAEQNVLYCRSKLLCPNNEDVTHKLNIKIVKNGEIMETPPCTVDKKLSGLKCGTETSTKHKQPNLWKIICLDELSAVLSDDNVLELFVETVVYGNDSF